MRLLFVNSYYAPDVGGGAEIMLRNQVDGLRRRGHEVAVACTVAAPGVALSIEDGVSVYRVGVENYFWPLAKAPRSGLRKAMWHLKDRYNYAMARRLGDVLDRVKPDVVVCHNLSGWSISAWSAIQARGVPIIQVLHDAYLRCPKSTAFRNGAACSSQCGSCRLFRYDHADASAKVDAVVGVSGFILKSFVESGYFESSRKVVIENAQDLDSPFVKASPTGCFRFGFLGSLVEAKGVGWLLDQFRSIDGSVSLVIGGRGDLVLERRLRSVADERVRFLGYVDPKTFFAHIDALVVPSLWPDTFPGVAYEACGSHVPVIASRIGGLPEIVQDGVNGLLCDPCDPESLGRAMRRLVQSPGLHEQLVRNARSSVARLLDANRMLTEYEQLFESTRKQ